MCGERQRISIIGLLVALVIASFGCGGGSRANPAAGGDFTTALMPDIDSTSNEDGENAPADPAQNTEPAQQIADNGNQEEGGGNVPTSTIVSTPGDGGNTPPSLQQNTPPNPTPIPQTARQFDYSIIPEGHIALPPGHGLDPGEIRVSLSEHHGDIIITCPPSGSFSWCDINIGEDGLATYDKNRLIPILQPEQITLPRSVDAAQAPVLDFVNVLHVGADVAPRADELTEGVDRNGVRASYGQIQDGIGADRVLEFLGQHTRLEDKLANSGIGTAPGLETYPEPPTIHLAEGTSDLYARFAAHAVQLINNALPYEKRITLNSEPLPADSGHSDIPEGEIFLEFTTQLNGRQLGGASLSSSYVTDSQTQQQEVQSAINARAGIFEKAMRSAFVHSPTEEDRIIGQPHYLIAGWRIPTRSSKCTTIGYSFQSLFTNSFIPSAFFISMKVDFLIQSCIPK